MLETLYGDRADEVLAYLWQVLKYVSLAAIKTLSTYWDHSL